MTKEAALKKFFNSFGIPGYPVTAVPVDVSFGSPEKKDTNPYLTYEPIISSFESGQAAITVNLWYYAEGESAPNEKAREMSERIGMGGIVLPCDNGAIWLKRGNPWCQSLQDEADPFIKRRYIQVIAEYLTQD